MPREGRASRRSAKAIALRYDTGLPAPFLAAKASGRAVDRLLAIAEEAGLPMIRDGALTDALYPLDLGDYVPEAYFEIVAKVFAFVKSIEEA
ncbi:MAG TPA: EscU/YscU/HrcU family type III secretion system export apparatus switch protein [Rectinemataceae bacterium]|nr:EscU/YscU/HrcU family type III secretion system export apparatus switch protein [Rectinemataceae bacterium]